eukprot:jgi/Psemu1/292721/fgenesh1_pg.1247_\
MSDSVENETIEIDEGPEALAAAVDLSVDDAGVGDGDDDDESTGSSTVTLHKLIHAEVNPPKSLVLIWALMAAELGFDLITTAIAFFSTIGKQDCCGHRVYLGPLPVTTSIPFFFLIATEITFLGRAILLTLWPSIFEARRVEFHGNDGGDDENVFDDHQVGFEVTLTTSKDDDEKSKCQSNHDGDDDDDDGNQNRNQNDEDGTDKTEIEGDALQSRDDEKTERNEPKSPSSTSDADETIPQDEENVPRRDKTPIFVDTSAKPKQENCLRRTCCCFLRWNARMVLWVLNLLTLLNPFFGCLIAYILLYQSDKTECFVVLGIESLSIVLHFVSVRLEGGLRTWWSKALHSVALIPFLVSVILVLVFLREGGMCYSVESELFLFSGCEVCPDTLVPPVDGKCGNTTLEGVGGFQKELANLGNSFTSVGALKNITNLAKRGAEQGDYCSSEVNFCFFEF